MNTVIYVDVDDTLIRSVGPRRIPNPHLLNRLPALIRTATAAYLWSAGGADYAREVATELGIDHLFTGFLPKPTLYIDDQPAANWPNCRHVLPTNL